MNDQPTRHKTPSDMAADAYLEMAQIGYRPMAPSDGCGGITASLETLDVRDEARRFAEAFIKADDEHQHWVGCCDYSGIPVVAMLVEAIRIMNGGHDGFGWAQEVIGLASKRLDVLILRHAEAGGVAR